VENSAYWRAFTRNRADIADRYVEKSTYSLFAFEHDQSIEPKSWESFLLKSFRRNVLNNDNWPAPPINGWTLPDNWYVTTHDIVRTTLVVKYLDGVEFLVSELQKLAEKTGTQFSSSLEARDEGYYAAHTYGEVICPVPTAKWDVAETPVQLEVQITTQLQEVIRRLTHENYEQRRVKDKPSAMPWQWDYAGREFDPNYLGHILHYMEGTIMKVRANGSETKQSE
jgi:hypothetical protein